MPGIVGIIGGPPKEQPLVIQRMIETMLHEPGYVHGTHFEPSLGVYAGWVAHPGSCAQGLGRACAEGRLSLILSGQCFGQGATSGSDRVVLETYETNDEAFVEYLDGSFAGLLIDPERRRVHLFNDRFGIERIYYHETEEALFFASEAKALLRVLPALRHFDEEGVAQFLAYGSTFPETTLFHNLRIMRPGSIWTSDGWPPVTKRTYFQARDWEERPVLSAREYRERLPEVCRDAVQRHLSSDSKVGISVTGGLDTRMIVACLPEFGNTAVCYTFAGMSGETLDVQIGRRVAQLCGMEHYTLRIGEDFTRRYDELVDRTVYVTDGYAGALGAHEIYLNAKARELSPVRLTGNFGSEILRGMSTFKPTNLSRDLLAPEWQERIAALSDSASFFVSHHNGAAFAAFREIPSIHFGIPAATRSQVTLRMPFVSNEVVELAMRAPVAERASPEACAGVIERYNPRLAAIPTDRGVVPAAVRRPRPWNRIFAELTFKLDYLHKEGLPPALSKLEPALQGLSRFGVIGLHKYLPYRSWFRHELGDYVRGVIEDSATREMPWWDRQTLRRIFVDHQSGRRNCLREINAVVTLASVQRLLLSDAAIGSRLEVPEPLQNAHTHS